MNINIDIPEDLLSDNIDYSKINYSKILHNEPTIIILQNKDIEIVITQINEYMYDVFMYNCSLNKYYTGIQKNLN